MKKRQRDIILAVSGIFIMITIISFFSTSFIKLNKRVISVQNRMVEVTKEVEQLESNIKIIENENSSLKELNSKLEEKIQILEEKSDILNDKVEEVVSLKQHEKDKKDKLENLDVPLNADIKKYIVKVSEKYEIDPYIMYAVISVESSFNLNAVGYNKNGTYDSGLCQINSSNRRWLSLKGYNIDDVYGNIEAGAHILSINLKKTNGNYARALTGYNTGKVNYENSYSAKVLKKAETYKSA